MPRTEEELITAFNAGELSDEEQTSFLNGELGETTEDAPTPDTVEGTSEEEVIPAENEETPDKDDGEVKKEEDEEDPVVLAKDGKNTIPFTVVEDLRNDLQLTKKEHESLKESFEEQKGLLEKLTEAQKEDVETGTTEATDDVLSLLEEEFPGLIASFQKQYIDPLKAELEPIKASAAEKKQQEEEDNANIEFNKSVDAIEPSYTETVGKQEFWDWFDKQSPLVRAAQTSSDPEVVAEVIKTYNAQKQAPASEKADDVSKKIKDAIENADKKSTVQSLSDIPGGSSPANEKIEAFLRLSPSGQQREMLKMSPEELNSLMNKIT